MNYKKSLKILYNTNVRLFNLHEKKLSFNVFKLCYENGCRTLGKKLNTIVNERIVRYFKNIVRRNVCFKLIEYL